MAKKKKKYQDRITLKNKRCFSLQNYNNHICFHLKALPEELKQKLREV